MKKILLTVIGLLLLTVSVESSNIMLKAQGAIVKLDITNGLTSGYCTAFSIDGKKEIFLTAAHCLGPTITVGGDTDNPAQVLAVSSIVDTAVIKIPRHGVTELQPAEPHNLDGQTIYLTGFGHGWPVPIPMKSPFLGVDVIESHPLGYYLIVGGGCIGGMSGGPALDEDGRVIGMIQRTTDVVCAVRPVDLIMLIAAPFWRIK